MSIVQSWGVAVYSPSPPCPITMLSRGLVMCQFAENFLVMCLVLLCAQQTHNKEASLRFTAVVNFNSELPQHVEDINILTVTSQCEEKKRKKIEVGG